MTKTEYEYQLWIDYGQGWEHEISEDSPEEIADRQNEYLENCNFPTRIKKVKHEVKA